MNVCGFCGVKMCLIFYFSCIILKIYMFVKFSNNRIYVNFDVVGISLIFVCLFWGFFLNGVCVVYIVIIELLK